MSTLVWWRRRHRCRCSNYDSSWIITAPARGGIISLGVRTLLISATLDDERKEKVNRMLLLSTRRRRTLEQLNLPKVDRSETCLIPATRMDYSHL